LSASANPTEPRGKDFRWRWETKMKWDSVVKRRSRSASEAQACSKRAAKASKRSAKLAKSTEETTRVKIEECTSCSIVLKLAFFG
jgi:hypothetical protein